MTAEVEKKAVEGAGGIKFVKPPSQVQPPFAGREKEEELQQELPPRGDPSAEEKVIRQGKMPLHPAVIRLPFSIFGRIGTELTGYPGFTFTEMELNDLAELWVACGIEMNPLLQASIGTSAMVGGKSLGYFAWVKAGKPKIAGAEAIGKETVEKAKEDLE